MYGLVINDWRTISMNIITINGIHQTGKTTTATAIIHELTKRGYTVGSIKEIHAESFAMDTKGTNTDLHRQAGASMVVARGMFETDILIPKALDIERILDYFHHDWVICEGVEDANALKIVTGISEQDCLDKWDERVIAISGIYSNKNKLPLQNRPVFHPVDDVEALVDYLIKHAKTRLPSVDDACCQACNLTCRALLVQQFLYPKKELECVLSTSNITVMIGQQPITMVPFVQTLVKNNVLAIISELEGYYPHKQITIEIKAHEIKKK
jgi:molybdopterin-guanine dinucleotide biosynthesis protein B